MRTIPSSEYGPRLAEFIDRRRGSQSVREFARTHGLDPVRISTWRTGSRPSYEHLRPTADGLGVTLGELLVVIGLGVPEDFTVTAAAPSVADAIEQDPTLSEDERVLFRDLLRMLRRLGEGNSSVTVTSGAPVKRGARRASRREGP